MPSDTANPVTKRRIYGTEATEEEWQKIDEVLQSKGWSSLNRDTTLLELIEDERGIVGFIVLQMYPMVGPEYVRPSARGTGIAQEMARDMVAWLEELKARGWLVICDSPYSEEMCKSNGMIRIVSPVYVTR